MFESQLDTNNNVVIDRRTSIEGTLPTLMVEKINSRIKELDRDLRLVGFADFEIMLNGAMACGHYFAPKASSHSLNPECPYDKVIECDLRVVFPEQVNLLDPTNIQKFRLISGSLHNYHFDGKIMRFGEEIGMVRCYDYFKLTDEVGLEFEICFNNRPYYEIAKVWKEVFTPEEVDFQRQVRQIARDFLQVEYPEFTELKSMQTKECRFRILAHYFLEQKINEGSMVLDGFKPLSVECPPTILRKVNDWYYTFYGDGYEKQPALPKSLENKMNDAALS